MSDEQDLVRRVLRRDPDAFRELVERYQALVFRIVARMVTDHAEREDLCQDVFLRVYDKLGSFRAEAKLGTWIARIAHHKCLHHLQKRRPVLYDDMAAPGGAQGRRRAPPMADIPTGATSPLGMAAASELRTVLEAEIGMLAPVYRTVVTLFHLEEMSIAEVSKV
ncbi:MAG TPA: sigma-70 family RNA polymerase sigma factor, partial [Longimicrobium sp.]